MISEPFSRENHKWEVINRFCDAFCEKEYYSESCKKHTYQLGHAVEILYFGNFLLRVAPQKPNLVEQDQFGRPNKFHKKLNKIGFVKYEWNIYFDKEQLIMGHASSKREAQQEAVMAFFLYIFQPIQKIDFRLATPGLYEAPPFKAVTAFGE